MAERKKPAVPRRRAAAPRKRPATPAAAPAAPAPTASAARPGSLPPSAPATAPKPVGPGFKLSGVRPGTTPGVTLRTHAVGVTVKAEFRPAARATGPRETVDVAGDDVLEIELAEGQRVWVRADEYFEQLRRTSPRTAPSDTLEVPADLPVAPEGMQARGPIAWAVKAVKVLGIDLHEKTAVQIGAFVDGRTNAKRPGTDQVFRCGTTTGAFSLTPGAVSAAGDNPLLVFIHGTASSTWGSFGELWSQERTEQLRTLKELYADRIYAFEHSTLSLSPIDNAIALARALPKGAKVHLVSHSRGGLVGELLALGNAVSAGAASQPLFDAAQYALFTADPRYAAGPGGRSLAEALEELDRVLRTQKIVVERFVRVACPALGTTLASGRLDRWLSVVGSVAGAALPETPLAETFADLGDFVAAVVKERTDPRTLPGLEAMMPESALIRFVNWPREKLPSELVVIAGDIEPSKWWAKLLVWATDRFYDGDHDLVVNTQSMYGGAPRTATPMVAAFKGPEVNHFNYFRNSDSARQLLVALQGRASEQTQFEPLVPPSEPIARAITVKPKPGPRPVVFLLPGIMGSELMVGSNRVWTDFPELIFGGLAKLKIDARNVKSMQANVRYYGALSLFLEDTHRVIDFHYDWRLPIEQEADRLAERMRPELAAAARDNMPVRIIAHSMGGLVARTMIARNPDVWTEICKHPGGRLVMVGTPTGGSHAVTELVTGQAATLRMLATLDIKHDQRELLEIVTRFPGLLYMLPKDPKVDYFSPELWADYAAKTGGRDWVLPDPKDLERARAFRNAFDQAPLDTQRMLYVAGNADCTSAAMRWDDERKRIVFDGTARGDGRVTWDSGIPPGLQVWYMDVEHGDMCAHEPAFPALLDLLANGKTDRLPQEAPVSRGAEALFPMPRGAVELYPNEDVLMAAAVGAGSRKHRKRARAERPVEVRVVHGNMAYASYPIMVGHYTGDTIVSAEAALDRMLGGQLTQRNSVGLYPAALNTSAFFPNRKLAANPRAIPKGAIVVGLGQVGQLTDTQLTDTVRHALLEYVIEWGEHLEPGAEKTDDAGPRRIGVSTLLIGTGAGGTSVSDSVFAILRAVASANRALDTAKHEVRIGTLEILELWEDRAILAVRALRTFGDPDLKTCFACAADLKSGPGARRRAFYQEPSGWWARMQILGAAEDGKASGALRFTATTRRARAEVRIQPTQRTLVDQYIEQSIRSTSDVRAAARTLFDLLVPNELKNIAREQDDFVLMLDEEAARYPWELLEDGSVPDAKPLVLQHGLLRQLAQTEFREVVRGVTADNALVVGDPVSSFPELRGAQAEAEDVWRVLQSQGGFSVEKHIRPTSAEVVTALFAKPYRVLHLAGHGVYEYLDAKDLACDSCGKGLPEEQRKRNAASRITGMVLGDGVFLTPVEVKQMRAVPELVFINCCHLGHIEPGDARTAEQRNERRDYNRIAANVSTEFIRMGVQAVVAAGWMVDDAAARVFGTTFYEAMLRGETFGEAVKHARKATYERYPYSNTWGAYQCYGDPDYRLVRDHGGPAHRDDSYDWLTTAAEAVVEIGNLGERVAGLSGASLDAALERLGALRNAIETKGWSKQAPIRAALARAYGQAERFTDAIAEYEAALQSDPARLTLKDIEALANFHVRSAADAAKGDAAAAKRRIENGMGWIRWLVAGPGASVTDDRSLATQPNTTSERLALMGSAYKRLWRIEPRLAHLHTMALLYRQADDLARARSGGHPDLYPLINRLYADLAVSWAGGEAGAVPASLVTGIAEARGVLAQVGQSSTDPWHWIVDADCDLLQSLVEGKLDDASADRLAEKYRNAAAISTPRQLASVVDQIEFLAAIAQARAPDVAERLRSLATRLSGEEAAPMVVFDEESVARAAPRKRGRSATKRGNTAPRGRSGGK